MPAASDATGTLQREILGAIGRVLDLVKSAEEGPAAHRKALQG